MLGKVEIFGELCGLPSPVQRIAKREMEMANYVVFPVSHHFL